MALEDKTDQQRFEALGWGRDFQGIPALEEKPIKAILMTDYAGLLVSAGWQIIYIIESPLSSQRLHPKMVIAMLKQRTLGVVRRSLIVARKRRVK